MSIFKCKMCGGELNIAEDEKICECDGTTPVYTLNLTGRLTKGDNLLSVCFDSADCDLALAGLSESFEVLRFGSAIIDSLSVIQTHEEGSVTLGLNLNLIGNPQSVRAVATLVSA